MRHRPTSTRARHVAGGLLLVIALGACADRADDGAEGTSDPSAPESSDDTPAPPSPSESAQLTAQDDPTPPGTVLDADEPALVEVPDAVSGRTIGVFTVTVDSVTKQPLSKLPAGVTPFEPSDLYYVEQTYTLLEKRMSLNGENLLDHTLVMSGGQPVQVFIEIGSNPRGCAVTNFENGDAEGMSRESCTAYLVPRGEAVDEVNYIDYRGEFDFIDGKPVRWRIES